MAERLNVHGIRKFIEDGIRKIRVNNHEFKEGIIRYGFKTEDFYIEHAERLYVYEGVNRIILVSRKKDRILLERLAKDIQEKSHNEWKRLPNDRLITEDDHSYNEVIEIIDSEKRGESEKVDVIQIDLVSDLYSVAECYLSEITETPHELPMKLVRILAGIYPKNWKEKYPKEWKEKLPGDNPHYDPKDILGILISMTSSRILADFFEFFRAFSTKKSHNVEEMSKRLETFLGISTDIQAGFVDLYLILKIIHKSLSLNSISEIIELRNEIDNYFRTVSNVEQYTDMLFRRFIELFDLLREFNQTNDLQDKLYFLEKSRKKIRESEVLVADKFVEPFKKFYLDIFRKWMDITFGEGEKLLDRALLMVRLQTRKAIWKQELLIYINIANIGISNAEKIKVILKDSSEYEILGQNSQEIAILHRNRKLDAEFRIRPQVKKNINLAFSVSYGSNKPININDTLIFIEKEEFRPVSNPYNFTRPAEESMFFGRDDLFKWIEHNMKGSALYQNVLMVGQRRTGKTSFLKQLQKRFSPDHYCIFIDLELYPTLTDIDFLYEICQELHSTIPNNISFPNLQEFAKKSYMAFGNYIRSFIPEISNPKRIVFIFDEFDKVEHKINEGLFKPGFLLYLRAFFLHNQRINAIVSGNFDYKKLSSREWREFFTGFNPRKVGVLDRDSAMNLVAEPVKEFLEYDQYAIEKILDFSGQNPFYIQLICHTLINYINDRKKKRFIEAEDIGIVVLKEAREKAESTLRLTWDELSQMERNILFALSHKRIYYRKPVELYELDEYLIENSIRIGRWRLRNLLDSLVEKDILKKSGDTPPLYDFNIILLEQWIAEHGRLYGE